METEELKKEKTTGDSDNDRKENKTCTCEECDCVDCDCESDCTCEDCACDQDMTCTDGVCEVKPKKEKKKKNKKNDEKLKQYEEKIKDLENKLLMQSADSINYRKRKDEEVARMMKFCNEDIIKDLLPVADNFERALLLAEDNTNEEFVKFIEGYKMIYCSLQNILSKFDVKAIDGANKPFDPVYHNAVLMEEKEGVEPGMVLEVLQKGYLYKDKVIRPAMVKVSE